MKCNLIFSNDGCYWWKVVICFHIQLLYLNIWSWLTGLYIHELLENYTTQSFKKEIADLSYLTGSVVDHLLNRIKALPLVWDVEGFKDVREGRVITADPADGSLQVKEALLLQGKRGAQILVIGWMLTLFRQGSQATNHGHIKKISAQWQRLSCKQNKSIFSVHLCCNSTVLFQICLELQRSHKRPGTST